MNEQQLKAIIEETVRAVLASKAAETCADDGKARALVIGDVSKVPETLKSEGYVLCPQSEYESSGNILRYQRVVITELSLLQLSDISLGRPGDVASCAVIQALLNGIETLLIEDGLAFRKYSGRCSTRLYAVLENNVKTLESFGVKVYTPERLKKREGMPLGKPAKYSVPAQPAPRGSAVPNPERLITEVGAKAMLADCGKEVHIPANSILTPSALDIFKRARVEIIKDR